jgi:hypothetical protein
LKTPTSSLRAFVRQGASQKSLTCSVIGTLGLFAGDAFTIVGLERVVCVAHLQRSVVNRSSGVIVSDDVLGIAAWPSLLGR